MDASTMKHEPFTLPLRSWIPERAGGQRLLHGSVWTSALVLSPCEGMPEHGAWWGSC